ncbi:PREDICTED: interferon-induced guanylate-binding protein 1-like [Chrysochloris asiatica]|uniref:Interferon-induced guanylate-binding protein 1-like n=1 Tax=Chrysochloris asiatica TaxID=185453 RepID=A0A9B0SXP0_CHRAS|nr:PREDICTED: interferon-induced guanylate-binding protein 1-like [Chrysochloris asiatica]
MASEIHMPDPVCLIENINGNLTANQESLKILSAITQPVVVVAIVGLYRTGKSYLMNNYVTELTDRIRSKSSPANSEGCDSTDFVRFFPDFVWTLRDFSLTLEANGKPITPDEYLEISLKLKQGTDQKAKSFNEPRLCIRKFFPQKKCFIFDRPAPRKHLIRLEQLQEKELSQEFVEQVEEFCSYIFSQSKVKTLSGGIIVNGPCLENLILTYVNTISSGDLPCMENAVLALAQIENSAAVQKAVAHYDQQMGLKVQLPTETLQELLDLHRAIEREAIEVFMKSSFKDVDQKFQKELGAQLQAKRDDYYKQNAKASKECCETLLQDIFSPLEEDVKQGIFSKPGGYRLFIQKKQELMKKYYKVPRKGIQAEETLMKYLESKEDVAGALLQTDQSLTEKEKEIEVERVKAESAEAATKMLEKLQKKNQLMMEQKDKSYQEHVRQLTEKMQSDRVQLMAEQEKILALKLQEQKLLLLEGFEKESKKLLNEIQDIKNRPVDIVSGCIIL